MLGINTFLFNFCAELMLTIAFHIIYRNLYCINRKSRVRVETLEQRPAAGTAMQGLHR